MPFKSEMLIFKKLSIVIVLLQGVQLCVKDGYVVLLKTVSFILVSWNNNYTSKNYSPGFTTYIIIAGYNTKD